jgi:hypothetical protein
MHRRKENDMSALGRLFEQLSLLGYFLIFAGLFSLAGAGLNQDWFMEDWKVRFFSSLSLDK